MSSSAALGRPFKYIANNIDMKIFVIAMSLGLAVPAVWAADYGGYKGVGGMTAYNIPDNVYEYHYDKGFTGVDAMGWDPNLQYAWSRIGAAKTCGIAFDERKVLAALDTRYPQGEVIHKMIGIDFAYLHSKHNPKFCTEERVLELKEMLPLFEAGQFPSKF
ncbi:hypothetical protein [Leeia aquatica]|uniref:Uncharacterized protein n=1 Tax=Leeia aquatica TaxID=2725557 RepID=A0A847S620_9NEIS|nr:hypothetical protein [Leeia aquatica]NLR74517.1 hypothetical protein [Leeia aquatica]